MSTAREITYPDDGPGGPETRIADSRIERTEVHRGSGGGYLIASGTLFLLLATGLVLLPSVLPDQAWIVKSFAQRGVTSLPLYASGLLFCGLWLVLRMSNVHSVAAQRAAISNRPAIEGLGGEIANLRDGLQALRIEFVYLKDAVQAQVENDSRAASSMTNSDALYRLAASLDQLGQRLEEQMRSSQLEVRETLEELSSSIEVARLEGRDGRIHLGQEAVFRAGPAAPSDDSNGAVYSLDHEELKEASARDDAEPRERLGVLDLLDDLGRLLPPKTSPDLGHPVITSEAFEGVQDEGWGRHESPAGPLPAARRPDEVGLRKARLLASDPDESTDDQAIVTKLEELRTLLADARVRKALTTMEGLD